MKIIQEYRCELLLAAMMAVMLMTTIFPQLLPEGFDKVILLGLLLIFILERLHTADLVLKSKQHTYD